ncbi:MAG: hypothetical protein GHCLOJNM_02681 [bacterium]|nr:hypothetical protein [bacterium]
MSKPLSVAKFFPFALLTLSLPVQVLWAAVPDTITIQGTLEAPGGGPLTGTYSCAVRIWDASVGGSLLANMLNPMVLSDSGRFTLELSLGDVFVPPAQAWYDLGVDTDHNGIEEAEFFPHRVRFHSVPFARAAANSELLGGLPASAFVQSGSGGEGWSLAGNAAVAGDFLGTTNDEPLELRANNQRGLLLIPNMTSPNLVGGHEANTIGASVEGGTIAGGGTSVAPNEVSMNYGTVGGGRNNKAHGQYSTVGGGQSNQALSNLGTVGGGDANVATNEADTVSGGQGNVVSGGGATIGGGAGNQTLGLLSTVGGGQLNQASSEYATVAGGIENEAGNGATVGGGQLNKASGGLATVAGGLFNIAGGGLAAIGGGQLNRATATHATIAGGESNEASGPWTTVGGGSDNEANNDWATVAGGYGNNASGRFALVAGGAGNEASGTVAFVGGGEQNVAGGDFAATVGGFKNNARGRFSVVGGGYLNEASGESSATPGGRFNSASGDYSFAAGRQAKALGAGSFVWGDSNEKDIYAWGDNQFIARATGGFWFITAIDGSGAPSEGMRLPAGASNWVAIGSTTSTLKAPYPIEELRRENTELRQRLEKLEARLTQVEKLVSATVQGE